jgi:exosortase
MENEQQNQNDVTANYGTSPNVPNPPADHKAAAKQSGVPKRGGAFQPSFTPHRTTGTQETANAPVAATAQEPKKKDAAAPKVVEFTFFTVTLPFDKSFEQLRLLLVLIVIFPLTIFAFFPQLENICYAWWNQVDYSHGFLVVPLTVFFLYLRFDTYPGTSRKLSWIGLFPILISCAMRFYGSSQYMDAVEEWAIFPWVLGVVWFFYGTRAFIWALPSLCFLLFMFQLPYRFDALMKNHLQQIAAQFAAILLQLAGEAAIPIKNTIRLSTMELGVEAACSGIRFLISVFAIAFATILLMRRPWWQNIIVLLVAAPLALFVNAARITLTGLLLVDFPGFVQSITPENRSPSAVADEFSGYVMIAVALVIFFGFIFYLGKVFRRVEIS